MLQVKELTFTYPKTAEPALKGLNFSIEAGEIFGFLGPSGAGKSTTQKILIGLLRGYQGEVSVFGKDLKAWQSDYYERVGISFESPTHFLKLTALENLTYFRALYSGETQTPQALCWCPNTPKA
jgi:fluoroquinolone transport system ATP-binding protein